MNDGIPDFIFIGFALQQIEQAIFAYIPLAIEVHYQPGIQVTIIPELVIEVFLYKMKILKNRIIRHKSNQCSIALQLSLLPCVL